MINLKSIYGDNIFDRGSSYRKIKYIPLMSSFLLDFLLAWIIISIFQVHWEYAFIKVYGILLLFGLLKCVFTLVVDSLNYRFTIKPPLAAEMKHYLSIFNQNVYWNDVYSYDDFLLRAAFNKALSTELRVLAGMNYGSVLSIMEMIHGLESKANLLFCQIARNYRTEDEE